MGTLKKLFSKKITAGAAPYFFLFVVSNALLAYSSLGFQVKCFVGLMGLVLPLAFSFWMSSSAKSGEKIFAQKELFTPPTAWVLAVLFGLALFLRFHKLVSLPVWPMWDDAVNSFLCIKQSEDWSWHLWYTSEKTGPLCFWWRAFFYKIISPSLFSMWFVQAVQSSAALLAGYWACRQYFSRSFALLCALILGFSFWTLYLGQFCGAEYLMTLWELISLGLLGAYLKSIGLGRPKRWAFAFGLCLGLGIYIWIIALVPVFILAVWFCAACLRQKRERLGTFLFFAVPFFILWIPALLEIYQNLTSGHVAGYLAINQSGSWTDQLRISMSYLTVFLWGTLDKSYFNFGPLWGGYLNPLLGTALLFGLLEIFRFRRRTVFYVWLGVLALCLAPGLISNTLEMMRVLAILPFVVVLCAVGIQKGLGAVSNSRRILVLVIFFVCSLGLDLYHLWGPYHRWAVPDKYSAGSKSPEHYRAFQVLEKWSREKGPGFVFGDFYHDVFDQSLFVATYGFNTVVNRKLSAGDSQWAGVIIGPWELAAFGKRFSSAVFFPLSNGLENVSKGMALAMVPVSSENRDVFLKWAKVHKAVQDLYPDIPYHVPHPSYDKLLGTLWEIHRNAFEDPFLSGWLLDKIACYSVRSENLIYALPLLDLANSRCSDALSVEYAVVFHRLGRVLAENGDYPNAERAFQSAARCDSNYSLEKAAAFLERIRKGRAARE